MTDWTSSSEPSEPTELTELNRTRLRALAPGLAATGLVLALAAAIERSAPEPLWLRWVRSAADHPVRVWLAVSLLTWASRPPAPAPARRTAPEAGKTRFRSI